MQLTVHTFVTLDGVMQGPGAVDEDASNGFELGGWLVPLADADMDRIVASWFEPADELLLGRSTYDMMQAYWSGVTDPDNAVATALNGLPKHVVSSTLTNPTWTGTSVISTDIVDAVTALKAKPGRELQVHGSWRLARTLHDAGLVDEYRLLVFPVVVGEGKRLFAEGAAPSAYELVRTEVTGTGAMHQVLRPRPIDTGDFVVRDGKHAIA